ncbi:hypothetical protein [Pseudomonas brassicacearum]|uniref:hypothetical protein n=1 Tax=Pseudomonas brassicacearum TaxID=930166 RepID=UPI00048988CC|nr:hypothetical protein [Pseudomonas brassicacearum]
MSAIKERPILFSAPMVRAILEDRKTVTRRQVKCSIANRFDEPRGQADVDAGYPFVECEDGYVSAVKLCPYGQPGDRLWVRETWAEIRVAQAPDQEWIVYRECDNRTDYGGPWKPSIFMPRRACRILLEITAVRVERLQDISDGQAEAEGIDLDQLADAQERYDMVADHNMTGRPTTVGQFAYLWGSINGAGAWDANPWVWAITFRRVEK